MAILRRTPRVSECTFSPGLRGEYPPFEMCIEEAGGVVERVPLIDNGVGWELDLAGIESACASGAKRYRTSVPTFCATRLNGSGSLTCN